MKIYENTLFGDNSEIKEYLDSRMTPKQAQSCGECSRTGCAGCMYLVSTTADYKEGIIFRCSCAKIKWKNGSGLTAAPKNQEGIDMNYAIYLYWVVRIYVSECPALAGICALLTGINTMLLIKAIKTYKELKKIKRGWKPPFFYLRAFLELRF